MVQLGFVLAALVLVRHNEASQIRGASAGTGAAHHGQHVARSHHQAGLSSLATELKGKMALKEISKQEMMAHMTVAQAYTTFRKMNRSVDSDLAQFLQSSLEGAADGNGVQKLRRIKQHGSSGRYDENSGLYTARDMLNELMDETIINKEIESEKCENYERKQLNLMWESQQDIDFANAQAADARAAALRSQQLIATIQDVKIPALDTQLDDNTDRCNREKAALQGQLALVGSDMNILRSTFSMLECPDVEVDLPEPVETDITNEQFLLQMSNADGRADDGALVQCPPCATGGKPAFHVRNSMVQAKLQQLKSAVAKEYLNAHFQRTFAQTERLHPSKVRGAVLVQEGAAAAGNKSLARQSRASEPSGIQDPQCGSEDMGEIPEAVGYRGCASKTMNGYECQKWTSTSPQNTSRFSNETGEGNEYGLGDHNYCRNPTPGEKHSIWCYTTDPSHQWGYCLPLEVISTPGGVVKHECVLTGECKLANVNCQKLRDGELTILAGIIDKHNQLSADLARVETECTRIHGEITGAIQSFNVEIQQEQTALAVATKKIQEATNAENLASLAHAEYLKDYHEQMKKCCDNKNSFLAELCSLEKLRGELFRMEGVEVTIVDCEVSDWTDAECSEPCAGGRQHRSRTVVAHTVNGTECPPMSQERDCNMQSCPIDCHVGTWSEWAECSAGCGGGVKTRIREITTRPKYEGEQCESTEEEVECNPGSCNEDCALGDWAEWSGCSKVCDGGHRLRRMPVVTEARGSGQCPHADSEERLGMETCNEQSCQTMVPDTNPFLRCQSKLDLVIMMDSSGSLTAHEFEQAKEMVRHLLNNMALFHDEEYDTLRNDVSLWDVAAQRQVELSGPDALKLAELITPRALSDMKVGDCRYAVITNTEGIVHNDPVVLRVAEDRFWFSIADSDLILWVKGLAWALSQGSSGLDVSIGEPGVSPCAVQGPKSVPLLQELFGEWVGDLKYYKFRQTTLDGMPILLSRSGFSPERGYELYLQDESRGNELWQRLMDAGHKYGIKPGVPNQIRRIEGGMLNYGADIKGHNALELGLPKRMVTKAADFIGKEALEKIAANGGPARRVVGVELAPKEPIDAFLVHPWKMSDARGREVGSVTSFCFSPMLSANIGFATVQIEAAEPGTKVRVDTARGACDAVVRKLPFMKRM